MFSRVFDTAKRILSRSPSYQGESQDTSEAIPRSANGAAEDEAMVTTRRGTGTEGSVQSTPASSTRSTRGKRHLEVEAVQETPTATKRRKKAAAKEAPASEEVGEDAADGTKVEGTDPTTTTIPHRTRSRRTLEFAEASTPVARRGSPKILIPEPQSEKSADEADVFYTPAQHSFAAGPDEEDREGSLTPKPTTKAAKATPASGKGSGKRGRPRKYPQEDSPIASKLSEEIPSSTWESEQAPLSPVKPGSDNVVKPAEEVESLGMQLDGTSEVPRDDATITADADKKSPQDQMESLTSLGIAYEDVAPDSTIVPPQKHKRFGSEEPPEAALQVEQKETPTAAVPEDDGDGSDSDEAPELVTTSAAVSKAKAVAQETTRALQAQQAKEDKRRQERIDRIAQEQAEKREREAKKARKLAKNQAKLARRQQLEASSPARAAMDVDMHNLPDLLPASVLEAAGDCRPPTPPPVRGGKTDEELRKEKMNRHIKFLDRSEQSIKDVKKGKLNVSVLAQRNALLAPKVNRDTKNIREHWLKGREAHRKGRGGRKAMTFKKMERRAVGGGFLRGSEDD